jgi:ABC-type antimicrobial peptide transport system permease subunit
MFARRKPLGAFGAIVGVVLVVVAIFASQIATHDPQESSVAHRFAPPGSERYGKGIEKGVGERRGEEREIEREQK